MEANVMTLGRLGVWEKSDQLKDGEPQKLLILSCFFCRFSET
jgi:hypothetical protein